MDFMKCEWVDDSVKVTLVVKDYPARGVSLDEFKDIIQKIREQSSSMIIVADLKGAGIVGIERFKSIVKIVTEVVEYTKDDDILREIQFVGTGVIFRALYGPISLAIPKYFRDMVVFL